MDGNALQKYREGCSMLPNNLTNEELDALLESHANGVFLVHRPKVPVPVNKPKSSNTRKRKKVDDSDEEAFVYEETDVYRQRW
jgi:hypothetical protein